MNCIPLPCSFCCIRVAAGPNPTSIGRHTPLLTGRSTRAGRGIKSSRHFESNCTGTIKGPTPAATHFFQANAAHIARKLGGNLWDATESAVFSDMSSVYVVKSRALPRPIPRCGKTLITIPFSSNDLPADAVQPRARGEVRLSVKRRDGTSVLDDLRQSGSLKSLFPRVHSAAAQAVLVNTAGGITGGDRFAVSARAGAGTDLTVTTQAAERAYRAQPGEIGRLNNRLSVASGARFNWLPQETILFQGCALERTLRVDLAADAQLLLGEPLVFGRAAMGERLTGAHFRDRIEIWRGDDCLFVDAMTLTGDIDAHLARPTIANGAGAMALLVYVAPDAEAQLPKLRAMLPQTAGASLIRGDLLCIRALAPDSYDLRLSLIPILNHLTGDALPKPWMI